jgi:FixJ family two-component response regulator
MGAGPILFVEDDDDLREAVMEVVGILGRDCLAVGSYRDLLELDGRALGCALAILDINLGRGAPSGLDAYRWLRREGFRGRVVFLTGHAGSHPLVEEARRIGEARVFSKPIDANTLRSLVTGAPS